jgi:hypothetical protein
MSSCTHCRHPREDAVARVPSIYKVDARAFPSRRRVRMFLSYVELTTQKRRGPPLRSPRSYMLLVDAVVVRLRQMEVRGVDIASVDADVLCGQLSHQTLPCCGLGEEDGFTRFLAPRVNPRRRLVQPRPLRKGRPAFASDSTFLVTWHRSPLPSVEHNASRYQPTALVLPE